MPRPPHAWCALVCLRFCYIFTAQREKKITEESESISEAAAHFFSSATCRINTPFNGLLELLSLYIFKEKNPYLFPAQIYGATQRDMFSGTYYERPSEHIISTKYKQPLYIQHMLTFPPVTCNGLG